MTHFTVEIPLCEAVCHMGEGPLKRLIYSHALSAARKRGLVGVEGSLPPGHRVECEFIRCGARLFVALPDGEEVRFERFVESSGVCLVR